MRCLKTINDDDDLILNFRVCKHLTAFIIMERADYVLPLFKKIIILEPIYATKITKELIAFLVLVVLQRIWVIHLYGCET